MGLLNKVQNIKIEDYTYNLTDDRIAKEPLNSREGSKLLIYNKKGIIDSFYSTLDKHLNSTLLVFNNTKVVQARLLFKKPSGGKIEIFSLEPVELSIEEALSAKNNVKYKCLVGGAKKWKEGKLQFQDDTIFEAIGLSASKIEVVENSFIIEFSWSSDDTFSQVLEKCGELPLPPYMNRKATAVDKKRYQTSYAKHEGSVAAPTAGLHFTKELKSSLAESNKLDYVTLHVGAGTFMPVKSDTMQDHTMHFEIISIKKSLIENIKETILNEKKVIPVGTTSMRTLESLYWIGNIIANESSYTPEQNYPTQWTPYDNDLNCSVVESLDHVLDYLEKNGLQQLDTKTQIIIAPGYEFKICGGLITNFHQPKSTLLLLVAALIGKDWRDVYEHALNNNYRFLSYGDGCLLLP